MDTVSRHYSHELGVHPLVLDELVTRMQRKPAHLVAPLQKVLNRELLLFAQILNLELALGPVDPAFQRNHLLDI